MPLASIFANTLKLCSCSTTQMTATKAYTPNLRQQNYASTSTIETP